MSIAQPSQCHMLGALECSIPIKYGYCLVARHLHDLRVGGEVGDVELKGVATLLCAMYVACAT